MTKETRYTFVARQLTEGISSGTFKIGSLLPTELELADQYNVSRATIRLALSNLQQLGLISRKRNVGTRVVASSPPSENSSYMQSLATLDDLLQYAENTRRVLQHTAVVVADFRLAERLQCQPGKRWWQFSTIREPLDVAGTCGKADSETEPLCWTDIYVEELYGPLISELLPGHSGAISDLIEARAGKRITEVLQSLTAVSIPEEQAAALRTKPGSPGLEIARRYLDETGQAVVISFSIHPGARFSYGMRLRRNSQPGA